MSTHTYKIYWLNRRNGKEGIGKLTYSLPAAKLRLRQLRNAFDKTVFYRIHQEKL